MGVETVAAVGGMTLLGAAQGILSGYGTAKSSEANAQSQAISAAASAAQLRANGRSINANKQIEAANYDAQAEYYLREAANVQMQGMQERSMRTVQLGQEVGGINAQAAGSGISVDSRTVQKTILDTTKSAMNDLEMSAINEYQQAYGAMKNRKVAQNNAYNARSIGAWAQSEYESLAQQTEWYGNLTAQNTLEAGYTGAMTSTIGGVLGGIGSGIGLAAAIK